MPDVAITWIGHGSFRIDTPGGKRLYLDPWLDGNPSCPSSELVPERCDIVAVTHGHFDHVAGVGLLHERFQPPVIAIHELALWLAANGAASASQHGMGKGGTQTVLGVDFTLTTAHHSSSTPDGTYAGEACGFVIRFENGTTVFVSGDTDVHSDMALIGRLHQPDAAILAIGDHYTMGPRGAALALELLGPTVRTCIPGHWGTFPALTGTPDVLRPLCPDVHVAALAPGETVVV